MDDDDAEERARDHLAPVYNPPMLRHHWDAVTAWSFVMTIAILGLLFALGTEGVAQWILNTAAGVATPLLMFSSWRWWQAIHWR